MKLYQLIILIISILLITFVIFGIKDKYEKSKVNKVIRQEKIIDCVNRNNTLEWCLESFY